MGTGKDLVLSTPRSIDRQAFAAELMRQKEGATHVFRRGGGGQVNRFGHAAVAVTLENGLHPYMVGRRNVVGGDEQTSEIFGDLCQVLNGFPLPYLAE